MLNFNRLGVKMLNFKLAMAMFWVKMLNFNCLGVKMLNFK